MKVGRQVEPMIESDHALVTGKLQGEEQELRFRKFIEAWKTRRRDDRSASSVYREFIDDLGVSRMIEYIEARDSSCHGILHDLGGIITDRTTDLNTAIAICNDSCTYACAHGVFRTYFVRKWGKTGDQYDHPVGHKEPSTPVDLEQFKQEVDELCKEDSEIVKDFFRGNCAHSLGHAFGMLAKGEVKTATEYCTAFDDLEMQYYCQTGVFMEIDDKVEARIYPPGTTRQERLEAGMKFCLEHGEVPGGCMRFLLKRHLGVGDAKVFAQECLRLDGRARRGCFNALGFFSRSYVALHPRDVGQVCRYGDRIDQKLCISGVMFTKKDNRKREKLAPACEYLEDKELRALCKDQQARFYYQVDNPVMDLMF